MAFGTWIGGFLGWMTAGPLGALAGIVLGKVFDAMMDGVNTPETQGTFEDPFGRQQTAHQYQQQRRQYTDYGQRNSFLFSLLVLASYIMKADGRVMHSEMGFVLMSQPLFFPSLFRAPSKYRGFVHCIAQEALLPSSTVLRMSICY